MIYGRPISIPHVRASSGQISLPQPIDDKYLILSLPQPDDQPAINAFFVSSTNLYQVMDEIIEHLHQHPTTTRSESGDHAHSDKEPGSVGRGCGAVKQLTSILQLDGLLQRWHACLPWHLKFSLDKVDHDTSDSEIFQRQRVILKTRFLGMRTLLHRQTIIFLLQDAGKRRWPRNASQRWPPLFLDDAGQPGGSASEDHARKEDHSSFETQLARMSARTCLESAQMQVEMIDYFRQVKLTGAWWWDFHCMIPFARLLVPNMADCLACSRVQLPLYPFWRHEPSEK